MRKRIFCFVLVVLTLSAFLFANGAQETQASGDKYTGKMEFPLEEPVELSIFVRYHVEIDDFETNAFTKWLEEKTNIKLKFITSSEAEAKEKLNLLLAAGDYPDIITSDKLTNSQINMYGANGIFIPLNDLIEKYGTHTKKAFENYPAAKRLWTAADGNIYNLGLINDCYHAKYSQKIWIYEPWLKEAGLDMPTTTEEFRHVLKEFAKRGDDVIPFLGATAGWKARPYQFLMNSFVYYSESQSGLYLEDGKIVASFAQPGWKEGLKYCQQLRQDGTLAKQGFTLDKAGLKQICNNPDKVIVGAFAYGYSQGAVSGTTDRWLDYVCVPPLKGPNGVQTCEYMPYRNDFSSGLSITDKCKNPEVAFLLADFFYSEESTLRMMNGREGIEWEYVNEGIGINGETAMIRHLVDMNKNPGKNVKWGQIANSYRDERIRFGTVVKNPKTDLEVILYQETKDKYFDHRPDLDDILPPLAFTDDEAAELVSFETSIESFWKERLANFILNDEDIDAQWDDYLKELERIGLDKMLKIYQQAYDRNF